MKFVIIGIGQTYSNLKYVYLKTFTFHSLLIEVLFFEKVNGTFTI